MSDIKIKLRELPSELMDDFLVKLRYRKAKGHKMATYKVRGIRVHRNGQEVTLLPANDVLRGVLEDQIHGLPLKERILRRIEWRNAMAAHARERAELQEKEVQEWDAMTEELLGIINRSQSEGQTSDSGKIVHFPFRKHLELSDISPTTVE